MRLGLVACDILKNELEFLLKDDPDFVEKKYLEFALHVDPENMKEVIVQEVNEMLPRVDAILLGYAVCSSLDGIESRFSKPVIKLPGADCIDALLGSEEYTNEKKICAGTWFNTPGWADAGTQGLIKELHLDCLEGYEPEFFLDMLFGSYERVLYIDPGIGNSEEYERKSFEMSKDLKLSHACRGCDLRQLEETIKKVKEAAGGA